MRQKELQDIIDNFSDSLSGSPHNFEPDEAQPESENEVGTPGNRTKLSISKRNLEDVEYNLNPKQKKEIYFRQKKTRQKNLLILKFFLMCKKVFRDEMVNIYLRNISDIKR